MSIGEVHDVGGGAALPVSQADAVLQDHVRGVVLPQVGVHNQGADLAEFISIAGWLVGLAQTFAYIW